VFPGIGALTTYDQIVPIHLPQSVVTYCDALLQSCNLRIRWAELSEARSNGTTKYTVILGFDEAFGDISMVTTF
jgi:hypothetical protein